LATFLALDHLWRIFWHWQAHPLRTLAPVEARPGAEVQRLPSANASLSAKNEIYFSQREFLRASSALRRQALRATDGTGAYFLSNLRTSAAIAKLSRAKARRV
jgi:hypothetical protein